MFYSLIHVGIIILSDTDFSLSRVHVIQLIVLVAARVPSRVQLFFPIGKYRPDFHKFSVAANSLILKGIICL